MDSNATGIAGLLGLALSITGIFISAVNHKYIRSKCCGRHIEASIDIGSTSPLVRRPRSGTTAVVSPSPPAQK